MQQNIPTYPLNNLDVNETDIQDVLVLNHSIRAHRKPVTTPHRTNYFGIGICLAGKATLQANLESYQILPGCLIIMSPHLIKQWQGMSDDFRTLAILFTRDFMVAGQNTAFAQFHFFENTAKHVFMLHANQITAIAASLNLIKEKYANQHSYRPQVLSALINGLLFEVASFYEDYSTSVAAVQSRSQLLTTDFKHLVNQHFAQERSVSYYAEKLFITPGHLTETIREVTGKTPGEWIAEAIVLEACVLLQNPVFTIAQVAQSLNFHDQSVFGKYFKNITGKSPATYRRDL
jgi:AraC-like DNA-binding protein